MQTRFLKQALKEYSLLQGRSQVCLGCYLTQGLVLENHQSGFSCFLGWEQASSPPSLGFQNWLVGACQWDAGITVQHCCIWGWQLEVTLPISTEHKTPQWRAMPVPRSPAT